MLLAPTTCDLCSDMEPIGSVVRLPYMTDAGSETLLELVSLMPRLQRYAQTLTRNPVDADDLAQETLLRAVAKIESYTPGTKLRAWLFTIMRNTFFTSVKKRRREQPGAEECVSCRVIMPARQEMCVFGIQLLEAINQLPEHYRDELILVVVLGESYESAAKISGCAVGTIKSRVNRGRAMVMVAIGESPGDNDMNRRA